MTIRFLEVLCEEPSAEVALRVLLGRLLEGTGVGFEIRTSRGKNDLLHKLPQRLAGYSRWLPDDYKIVILVDRDRDDCTMLKQKLTELIRSANLTVHSLRERRQGQVLPRIVVEELESWFLGDPEALRKVFPRISPRLQDKKRYRHPDAIDGAWETLERVLQAKGYYAGGYLKGEAARRIAAHMDPERNRSKSFQAFRDGVLDLTR